MTCTLFFPLFKNNFIKNRDVSDGAHTSRQEKIFFFCARQKRLESVLLFEYIYIYIYIERERER